MISNTIMKPHMQLFQAVALFSFSFPSVPSPPQPEQVAMMSYGGPGFIAGVA